MNVEFRAARSTDAGKTGAIMEQFQTETQWMPNLWTGAQTIGFCGTMIDMDWVEVAVTDGNVIGFIARDGPEICALYVAGPVRGNSVGRQLLNRAMTGRDRLWLNVFEANSGAQKFYQRAGFVETARSDGADNDENLPDITLVWQREETP